MITREKEKLSRLLKETGSNDKHGARQYMGIQVIGSHVTISDYSHDDDYKLVLALLGAAGIEPDVSCESWCG